MIFLIMFLGTLVYLSAYFSSSEIAITSLGRIEVREMQEDKTKNADAVAYLRENLDDTLTAIAIGNNIVNITLSAVSTALAYSAFGDMGVALAVGLVTLIVVIFGEIFPKAYASTNAVRLSSKRAKFLSRLVHLLFPLSDNLLKFGNGIIRFFGGKTGSSKKVVTEDAIKTMATLAEEDHEIDPIERDIIHRVFTFGDIRVRDVMIPRKMVYTISYPSSMLKAKRYVQTTGFSRIPVIDRKRKVVKGILYSKDLIGAKDSERMDRYIRRSTFRTKDDVKISALFQIMRRKRVHIAIVLNSRKKFAGIVTLEDIVEEIVGEIYDEYDVE